MYVPRQCSESCHSLVLQTGLVFSLLLFSLSKELVFTGALSLVRGIDKCWGSGGAKLN